MIHFGSEHTTLARGGSTQTHAQSMYLNRSPRCVERDVNIIHCQAQTVLVEYFLKIKRAFLLIYKTFVRQYQSL